MMLFSVCLFCAVLYISVDSKFTQKTNAVGQVMSSIFSHGFDKKEGLLVWKYTNFP